MFSYDKQETDDQLIIGAVNEMENINPHCIVFDFLLSFLKKQQKEV